MFSKIDKKVLIWLVAALAGAVLIGIAAYKQFSENASEVQNSVGGVSTKNASGSDDGFSVCRDECGNGVCQPKDESCDPKSLNCICAETPQECPQDCLPSGDVP